MVQLHLRNLKWKICLPLAVGCLGLAITSDGVAAGSFDGVYRGTQRATLTNNSQKCANIDNPNAVLKIENNHFTRQWTPATLSVDVAANGSFDAKVMEGGGRGGSGAPRVVEIKGQITGGNLEADIGSSYCGAHLSLKKS